MNRVTFDMVSKETPMVLENLQVYHHQDMAVNITRDIWDGKRHQGGVTFDVLSINVWEVSDCMMGRMYA